MKVTSLMILQPGFLGHRGIELMVNKGWAGEGESPDGRLLNNACGTEGFLAKYTRKNGLG
jgi:hypothetical protein